MVNNQKEYSLAVVVLCCCSVFTEYLVKQPNDVIFPRERIICLIISLTINFVAVLLINKIDYRSNKIRIIAAMIIICRVLITIYRFCSFYNMFYSERIWGIIVLSLLIVVIVTKSGSIADRIYPMFVLINVVMILMIVILSLDKFSITNITLTDMSVSFSVDKIWLFFDIVTIKLLVRDRTERFIVQSRFLGISVGFMVFTTIIQGLCVKGDLLYSLSPLQVLVQIISGKTIKRYDYIFTILFTTNYFGAVILYTLALKNLFCGDKCVEKT